MPNCRYYESSKKECNNPKNPDGIGTKSGVNTSINGRCDAKSEKCALNGGKHQGRCVYYDKSKKVCNNPQNPDGIGTKSGVDKSINGTCDAKCEKCDFLKGSVSNNSKTICPYCKKQISQTSKKIGRCSECGKYF